MRTFRFRALLLATLLAVQQGFAGQVAAAGKSPPTIFPADAAGGGSEQQPRAVPSAADQQALLKAQTNVIRDLARKIDGLETRVKALEEKTGKPR